jgi:hypothetical protein
MVGGDDRALIGPVGRPLKSLDVRGTDGWQVTARVAEAPMSRLFDRVGA